MDNTKILEMLNNGQIEELKEKISDEIFQEELKKSSGADAKKRYTAMKRYFKYVGGFDEVLSVAKAKGYKYKRSELDSDKFAYVWNYRDAYFKVGILD